MNRDENRKVPVTPNKGYCARLIASVKTRKGPSGAEELLFERLIAELDQGEKKYRQAANGL